MIKKKRDDKQQWFLFKANLRTKTILVIILAPIIIVSIVVSSTFIGRHFN